MKVTVTGAGVGEVQVDGEPLSPASSLAVFNHSPDGFAWGYGGSGPSQLALALLLHAGVDEQVAVRMHQDFKWATVATWPPTSGEHEIDPAAWVAARTAS